MNAFRPVRVLSALLALIWLPSCVMFRPPDREPAEGVIPEAFSVPGTASEPRREPWWISWESPELDELEMKALSGNLTLAEAWARLLQADAAARKAGAWRVPEVSGTGSASYTRTQEPVPPTGDRTLEDYTLALAGSYEVDLWGRVRATYDAALSEAAASREDLDTAVMTVSAQIADVWVRLGGAGLGIELLEQQQTTNEEILEIVELRFRRSLGSALDVFRQREAVERAGAAIPLVQAEESALRNELAVLLGRPPGAEVSGDADALPDPGPLPETGIPADLLVQRPDVRAARLRLNASDWRVSAAEADRMPALRLTARAGYADDEFNEIIDNWLLNLAGSLTGPIFDGGRRRAEVDRARAEAGQRLAAYRRVVLTALREVEDALVREDRQAEYIRRLELQSAAARTSLEEARQQYLKGVVDYLSVLVELQAVQTLDRTVLQARVDRLRYRIALHRALGGAWMSAWNGPPDPYLQTAPGSAAEVPQPVPRARGEDLSP